MQGKNIEATETQWDLRQASKFTHYTAIIDNFLRLETQGNTYRTHNYIHMALGGKTDPTTINLTNNKNQANKQLLTGQPKKPPALEPRK